MDVIPIESSNQPNSIYLLSYTLFSLTALYTFFQLRNKYYYWDNLGVKGDRYIPLSSYISFLFKRDLKKLEQERRKNYGKVYGFYMMGMPRLYICDPEVIKQICIKDFEVFPDHTGMWIRNKYQNLALLWLTGDHWKKVRAIMTPTFTSGKIKRMFRFMEGCAEELTDYLLESANSHESKVVDIKKSFSMFSLDGIATCCYGLKLKREGSSLANNELHVMTKDDFLAMTQRLAKINRSRMLLFLLVPSAILKAVGFTIGPESNWEPMVHCLNQLIKRRTNTSSTKKFDDLLQLLLDAHLDDNLELNELDQVENHHANLTEDLVRADQESLVAATKAMKQPHNQELDDRPSSYRLSQLEVLSEAIFLLAAGLETTTALLTSCVYALAYHPEVQEKLYHELRSLAEYDSSKNCYKFQYETLTSCQYLDAVISETLRLLPPLPMTDRKAEQDYYIKKYDVTVPKGSSVLLGIRSVQNDPDYWVEPEKFDPDRFMPENRDKIVPGSYMPFSMGPRHCIGMRFSLTESKLGLAKVVTKYSFHPAPGLTFPPKVIASPAITHLTDPRVILAVRDLK